jgi:hypothetical protein
MFKLPLILGLAALGLAALAVPAAADTLKEATTHGVIMDASGAKIEIVFTPDGKFTAFDGAVTGTWRIEGDKLCSMADATQMETCAIYPKDKKSGDTFPVPTPQGEISVTIK